MNNNKLETITNLFESSEIRSILNMLKKRMTEEEKSELSTKCVQLKMKAQDGKLRETDTLDTQGIFRLIESVPSPKAEPFKTWLAQMEWERIESVIPIT